MAGTRRDGGQTEPRPCAALHFMLLSDRSSNIVQLCRKCIIIFSYHIHRPFVMHVLNTKTCVHFAVYIVELLHSRCRILKSVPVWYLHLLLSLVDVTIFLYETAVLTDVVHTVIP